MGGGGGGLAGVGEGVERRRAPSGILLLQRREMSCEADVGNVEAVARVNGSYFKNRRDADGNVGDELEH